MNKNFKRVVLFTAIVIFGFTAFAQEWNGVKSRTAAISKSALVSSSIDETVLSFDFEGYYSTMVMTSRGEALILSCDKMVPNFEAGSPELPLSATSIIIPETGKISLEIVRADYYDVENVLVAPSKGMLSRTINPEDVSYTFGDVYSVDAFYPQSIASLSEPFILRDFRGVTVHFSPLAYNPVTKILRVYTNVEVKVKSVGGLGVNELSNSKAYGLSNGDLDNDFQSIYEYQFANFTKSRAASKIIEEEGSMLVICYDDFYDAMLPFVAWKNEKGIKTEMFKMSQTGTTSALIKGYIKEYYETNGNKYVLLVGDSDQLPSPMANGGVSDPSYAQIVGDDIYVDVLIGRFSARTLEHVNTYVTKVLNYEKSPSVETDWFSTGIGIGSREGPGHFNEYDYQHIRKIRGKLLAYNYYNVAELYEGSQGGEDVAGNPTKVMLAEKINAGASIINYIGHGYWHKFVTTNFNANDAKELTNYNMYPFIWSVACLNGKFDANDIEDSAVTGDGKFDKNECYAEAWTRNSKDGKPIGAIAFMGSSVNQPWVPPMYGQDEMNDILTETYQNNIKRSFGGLSFNGVYKMIEACGVGGAAMTANTWNCFGDPSVIVRTAMPEAITVQLPEMLPVGTQKLNINCPNNGAVVCVSVDGKIVKTATVVNEVVILDVSSIKIPSKAKVTISKYNTIPFQGLINFETINEPFLSVNKYSLVDDGLECNKDGILNVGETVKVKMTISNIGGAVCKNATITLSSANSNIEIVKASEVVSVVTSKGEVEISDIKIKALKTLVDKQAIKLTVTMTAGTDSWVEDLYLIPQVASLEIVATKLENANKRNQLNASEAGTLSIKVINKGSVKASNVAATLANVGNITITGANPVDKIDVGVNEEKVLTYAIRLSDDCERLYTPELTLNYSADNYEGKNTTHVIFFKKDVLVVNRAKNAEATDAISKAISDLDYSCDKSIYINAAEIAKYRALFIVNGIGTNSVALTDEQGDTLAAFLNNGGSIYMEGGDTFSYNKQTAVHPLFGIAKGVDGYDDLREIKGSVNAMFDSPMSFKYIGDNKFIDRFTPIAPAFTIFENSDPVYVTGVANKGDCYTTIGTSFAFSGLEDGTGNNTKKGLMRRYADFLDLKIVKAIGVNSVPDDNILVYPNPSKGKIKIDGDYNSLIVFDLSGRVVLQTSDNGNEINLTKLRQGVYVMKLSTDNGDITKKIVIE